MRWQVVFDSATPGLRDLESRASALALNKVIATSARVAVRDRFTELAFSQRNPWGKPPQFWKRMSRATRQEATDTAAWVVMPSEVRQRYLGGPIRPTGGKKYLTIPAQADAYRRSARSFSDLVFAIVKGRPALIRAAKPKARGKRAKGAPAAPAADAKPDVMYWLVRGVNQRGNPRVMPDGAEMQAAVAPDVADWLLRRTTGAGGVGV